MLAFNLFVKIIMLLLAFDIFISRLILWFEYVPYIQSIYYNYYAIISIRYIYKQSNFMIWVCTLHSIYLL